MKTNKPEIDPALVREIANLLSESDLTEIEVQQEDLRIRVVRQPPTVIAAAPAPAPYAVAAAPAAAPVAAAAVPVVSAEALDPAKHPGVVPSPMVGTAYLGPEPGARPFIEVGAVVKEGQTLLIVEAMKTMNAIPAPRAGTVTRILITNAQPVEYGEPLLIIE